MWQSWSWSSGAIENLTSRDPDSLIWVGEWSHPHRWIWTSSLPWKQPALWQPGQPVSDNFCRLRHQDTRSWNPASITVVGQMSPNLQKEKVQLSKLYHASLVFSIMCVVCIVSVYCIFLIYKILYVTVFDKFLFTASLHETLCRLGWIGVTLTHGMQDGPIVRLKCKRKLRVTETVSFKMAFQPEILVEAEKSQGRKGANWTLSNWSQSSRFWSTFYIPDHSI